MRFLALPLQCFDDEDDCMIENEGMTINYLMILFPLFVVHGLSLWLEDDHLFHRYGVAVVLHEVIVKEHGLFVRRERVTNHAIQGL